MTDEERVNVARSIGILQGKSIAALECWSPSHGIVPLLDVLNNLKDIEKLTKMLGDSDD